MPLTLGQILDGKYKVVRLIGEGGMGAVYEGENVRIARRVAIKALHAEAHASADIFRRFQREAQAAAKIRSPHIVDVLDLGDLPNGEQYMVMEFLEGEALAERIKRVEKLSARDAVIYAHQILEGLGAMHSVGIVHRDLKPANIFLAHTPKGEVVKILDFGVSKFTNIPADPEMLTRSGAVMGTPHYMSPEQARGSNKEVDARTDIYALGVMLYRMLSGVLPFDGENFHELLFKIALETPAPLPLLVPDIDSALAQIVEKAMARDPSARHQSADEMRIAIEEWGRKQGRPSLQFDRTVRVSSGSVRVAQVVVSATPSSSSERQRAAVEGKSTPTAWSEGKAAAREEQGKMGQAARVSEVPASVERRRNQRLVQGLAASLGVLAAAGVVLALRPKPPTVSPTVSNVPPAPTEVLSGDPVSPSASPIMPVVPSASVPTALVSASASAMPLAPVPIVPTIAVPKATATPPKTTGPTTAPSVAPAASSGSTPTAPAGSVRGRRIRTDL